MAPVQGCHTVFTFIYDIDPKDSAQRRKATAERAEVVETLNAEDAEDAQRPESADAALRREEPNRSEM